MPRAPRMVVRAQAIPFALLCMIVNLRERKQGSDPEGDEVL